MPREKGHYLNSAGPDHIAQQHCLIRVFSNDMSFIGVALITQITHVRNMRMRNINNNVTYIKYFASLPLGLLLKERICFLWEKILSFKSSPYFGSDYMHRLVRLSPESAYK